MTKVPRLRAEMEDLDEGYRRRRREGMGVEPEPGGCTPTEFVLGVLLAVAVVALVGCLLT